MKQLVSSIMVSASCLSKMIQLWHWHWHYDTYYAALASSRKWHTDNNQFWANFIVIPLINSINDNISALSRECVFKIMCHWNILHLDEILVIRQIFDHMLKPCTDDKDTPLSCFHTNWSNIHKVHFGEMLLPQVLLKGKTSFLIELSITACQITLCPFDIS